MISQHKYIKPWIPIWAYYIAIFTLICSGVYYGLIVSKINFLLLGAVFILGYILSALFVSPYIYIKKIKLIGIEKYESFTKINKTTISFIKNTNKLHNEIAPAYHENKRSAHFLNDSTSEFWLGNNKFIVEGEFFYIELDKEKELYKLQKNIQNFN
jgi:hypothetical protein